MHGGIDGRVLNSKWTMGIDWLESTMRLVDRKAFACFILILKEFLDFS